MSERDTTVPGDGDDRHQNPPPPDRPPEEAPVAAEVWAQAAQGGSQVPNPPTDPFAPPAVAPWSPSPPGPAGSVGQPGQPPPPPPETPTLTELEAEPWGQPPRKGVRTDDRRGGP